MSYGPGVHGALAAATAALLAWPAVAVAAERCARSAGRIVAVERGVEVAVGDGWRAVGLDQDLCVQDLLRTGPAGAGAVQLGDGTVLRVDQGTTLRVEGGADRRGFVVRLIEGVVSIFSRRAVALTVDTPFANAAVEGTEFVVAVASGRTRVAVLEGRVRVSNPQGELRLDAGGVAVARAGEAPVLEVDVRPRDAVRWALYYPPVSPDLLDGRPEGDLPLPVREALRLRREGRVEAALSRLDDVPPPARDALAEVLRAELSLASGRPDEAAAAIDRALARDPASGEALALRAVVAVARNDKAGALADARRAVELRPASAAARLALAYAQQADFDLDATRATLAEAARLAPADALARARLAEIELARGNLRAARRGAAEAARLAPDQARARLAEGFVALAALNTRAAKAAFARAIELDSLDPQARLGQGLARIRDGDLEGGRADLELAVALDPGNALLRSYLGKAYLEERRGELAGDELATAKELDPNDPTPWFYDAIRKQRENRPVEALRDLDEAIERNESRAVYRSRLLLDQDRASRGVGLARIYNDLGFTELGIQEAGRSLTSDPTNSAAHRFLADLYLRSPRKEIARVSELLQSQLLQPLSLTSVQPRTGMSTVLNRTGGSFFLPGPGEYDALLERNQIRASLAGGVGTDRQREGELVTSALQGNLAASGGYAHARSDGFRKSNDDDQDLVSLFAQYAATPALSLQAAYEYADREYADLAQRLEGPFFAGRRAQIAQELIRVGSRFEMAPGQILLASLIHADRDTVDRFEFDQEIPEIEIGEDGTQFELQQHLRFEPFTAVFGVKRYSINRQIDRDEQQENSEFNLSSIYGYFTWHLRNDLDMVIGLDGSGYDDRVTGIDGRDLLPKAGIVWRPDPRVALRLASFATRKARFVSNQTLEPTQIVGESQLYDDLNGTRAVGYGASIDVRPSSRLAIGAGVTARKLSIPFLDTGETGDQRQRSDDVEELAATGYTSLTLTQRVVATGGLSLERWRSNSDLSILPRELDTLRLPLRLSYFLPSGFFASAALTGVAQEKTNTLDQSRSEAFATVDVAAGYRFPDERGGFVLDARNLFDTDFDFEDDNFRSTNKRRADLVPERSVLVRAVLNF